MFVLMGVMSISTIACAQDRQLDSNVIIFVSFSMPKESIKGWMNEAKKINAPVVIRGLVNNSFKETIRKLNDLMSDNQGGVQLDPVLFNQFNIKQVPAVVVRDGKLHDVVYGDVHLDYALQTIIKRDDGLSSLAEKSLATLRRS